MLFIKGMVFVFGMLHMLKSNISKDFVINNLIKEINLLINSLIIIPCLIDIIVLLGSIFGLKLGVRIGPLIIIKISLIEELIINLEYTLLSFDLKLLFWCLVITL